MRRERRPSFSFLSRYHVSIISSSPRLCRDTYLSLPRWSGQDCHSTLEKYFQVLIPWRSFILKSHLPINDFCVHRACYASCQIPEFTGQVVGLMPPLSYCLGHVPCFCGMVFLLSKTALVVVFWVILNLEEFPIFFWIIIPSRINLSITYFVPSFPITADTSPVIFSSQPHSILLHQCDWWAILHP